MQKPLLNALPKLEPNGFTAVSLFSGGGLLDLGAIHAGLSVVWANDFEKSPCIAYRHNIGNHIVHGDITSPDIQALIPDGADFVIGGPPCQDFSVAGKGDGEVGERGKLVWTYLSIIKQKQPKAFLFENVKGLIQKKHRHTFDALLQNFDEIGYNVSWKLCNAWDFGVAQKRERVFIAGIRKDLGVTYRFPQSEHEASGYHPVIRDAIGDLPEPKQQVNGEAWTPPSDYTYDQANRVQSMDRPCATIPAHHNSGQPIHPTAKPRRFTVRECLRLQSVPDTYVFPEMYEEEKHTKKGIKFSKKKYSLSAMYKVVGNGVPSRLAYHLVKALCEQIPLS